MQRKCCHPHRLAGDRVHQSLGMSRATIYRKIREFGIVTPVR
ncbi:MAG: hypothetical protein ACXV2H_12310 [Actinomycetes bacterium]